MYQTSDHRRHVTPPRLVNESELQSKFKRAKGPIEQSIAYMSEAGTTANGASGVFKNISKGNGFNASDRGLASADTLVAEIDHPLRTNECSSKLDIKE